MRVKLPLVVTAVLVAAACVGTVTAGPAAAAPVTSTVANNLASDLDATGDTVPAAVYAVPSGAVFVAPAPGGSDSSGNGSSTAPFATITKAVNTAPAGGTVVMRGGVYRQGYLDGAGQPGGLISKGVTIQSYNAEQVWFDGTDVVDSCASGAPADRCWTADGNGRWSIAQATPSFCNGQYYKARWDADGNTCARPGSDLDPDNPESGDPQMIFVNGVALHEVSTLDEVAPRTFFYDWKGIAVPGSNPVRYADNGSRLIFGSNPGGKTVEVTRRAQALKFSGTPSTVKGIGFRRFASNQITHSTSAVYGGGDTAGKIIDSVFTLNAGVGVALENSWQVRHTVVSYNGYTGILASGHAKVSTQYDGFVLDASKIVGNNTEGFDYLCYTTAAGCAKAGVKLGRMNGYTVTNSVFNANVGGGMWCDETCSHGVIAFNRIARNISDGGVATGIDVEVSDSTIVASNLVVDNENGIVVASPGTRVYNNTVVGATRQAIWVYDDTRTPGNSCGTPVGPDTTNVEIVDNIISGDPTVLLDTSPPAAGCGATPTGVDTYFSRLDYNAYARTVTPVRTIVRWGSTPYGALSSFTAAHPPFESHGIDIVSSTDPFFTSDTNYRVRSNSPAYESATALPSDIRTALGITSTGALDRGALLYPGRTS